MRSAFRLAALLLASGCPSEAPPVAIDESGSGDGDAHGNTTSAAPPGSTTGGERTSTTSAGASSDEGASSTTELSASQSSDETGSAFTCIDMSLGRELGLALAVAELDSSLASRFDNTCGSADAPELAFSWTAPRRDFYLFDTSGSEFDTLLAVTDASCDAPTELACNDNAPGVVYSQVVQELDAGAQVFVIVESSVGESGFATVNVQAATCPAGDVTMASFPLSSSNVAGTGQFESPCAPEGTGLERTFRFTAPDTGLYRFRANASAFQPVLTVQDGPICDSPMLQCSTAHDEVPAEVVRVLQADQSVTLIVDSVGGSGEFALDVQHIADSCPAVELVETVSGSLAGMTRVMSTSCGYAGEVLDGGFREFESTSFLWTSPMPVGTSTSCDIVYTGGFPAVFSLLEGACDGPEVQCVQAEVAEERYTATLTITDVPPTLFTVTLARAAGELVATFDENYEISFNCASVG